MLRTQLYEYDIVELFKDKYDRFDRELIVVIMSSTAYVTMSLVE